MIRTYTKHDPRRFDTRLYFGGSSKSSSTQQSSQVYTDARQAIQNDSHNVSDSGNSSWLQMLSNVGNTTSSSAADNRVTDSGNVSNSGNTSASWTDSRSNSNSGNTSASWTDSRSNSTSNSGNTSASWTDSRSTSDSGNTWATSNDSHAQQTTVNYTGTDGGSVQIAALQAQLMGAVGAQNLDAVKTLTRFGAGIGDSAYELSAMSQANSMNLSTHMLDLTGELIDRLATGTGSTLAAQSAISQATSMQARDSATSAAGLQKMILIGGGLLLVAMILKH